MASSDSSDSSSDPAPVMSSGSSPRDSPATTPVYSPPTTPTTPTTPTHSSPMTPTSPSSSPAQYLELARQRCIEELHTPPLNVSPPPSVLAVVAEDEEENDPPHALHDAAALFRHEPVHVPSPLSNPPQTLSGVVAEVTDVGSLVLDGPCAATTDSQAATSADGQASHDSDDFDDSDDPDMCADRHPDPDSDADSDRASNDSTDRAYSPPLDSALGLWAKWSSSDSDSDGSDNLSDGVEAEAPCVKRASPSGEAQATNHEAKSGINIVPKPPVNVKPGSPGSPNTAHSDTDGEDDADSVESDAHYIHSDSSFRTLTDLEWFLSLRNPTRGIFSKCDYSTQLALRLTCKDAKAAVDKLLFKEVTLRLDDTLSLVPRRFHRSLPLLPLWRDERHGPGAYYDTWNEATDVWQNTLKLARDLSIYVRKETWDPHGTLAHALRLILDAPYPSIVYDMRDDLFPANPRSHLRLTCNPALRTYVIKTDQTIEIIAHLQIDETTHGPRIPAELFRLVNSVAPVAPHLLALTLVLPHEEDQDETDSETDESTGFRKLSTEAREHAAAALLPLLEMEHVYVRFVGWEYLHPSHDTDIFLVDDNWPAPVRKPIGDSLLAKQHGLCVSVWLILRDWLHAPNSSGTCCQGRRSRIADESLDTWLQSRDTYTDESAPGDVRSIVRHATPLVKGPEWIWTLPKRTKHPVRGVIRLKHYPTVDQQEDAATSPPTPRSAASAP